MEINNLELYKIFYITASTGNFSRAAEVLYTGQPSISKAIKNLEESLGTCLFIRNHRGVSLTEDGKILLNYVTKGMQEINNGEIAVKKSMRDITGKLTFGISSTLYKCFVFPNIKNFLEVHPNFTVNIVDNSKSHETIDAIKKGVLDLGVVSKPITWEEMDFIPISTVEEIVVSAPSYINHFDTSNLHDFFKQATLIFLDKRNVAREYNEQYLSNLGVVIKPEIMTSNMSFIIELVKLGVGIGIVYREAVRKELNCGDLIELNFLPKIPKRSIGIAINKNDLQSFAVREFIEYYSNRHFL